MKALYSLCITMVAATLLVGCGNSSKPATPAANSSQLQGIAAVKQAIQTFNTQEGHFPKTLDELSPKYLNPIPDAPGGYKYVYTAATGEVKLSR